MKTRICCPGDPANHSMEPARRKVCKLYMTSVVNNSLRLVSWSRLPPRMRSALSAMDTRPGHRYNKIRDSPRGESAGAMSGTPLDGIDLGPPDPIASRGGAH